jgi:hypothetical protein
VKIKSYAVQDFSRQLNASSRDNLNVEQKKEFSKRVNVFCSVEN